MIETNYAKYLKKTTAEEHKLIKAALERARQKHVQAMKGGKK